MGHNDAVNVFGSCDCGCHRGERENCWCHTRLADPHQISHNDRIEHFGSCDCRVGPCPHRVTSATNRRLLERRREAERDRRIRSGRLTSADVHYVATHPQAYMRMFGRGPGR